MGSLRPIQHHQRGGLKTGGEATWRLHSEKKRLQFVLVTPDAFDVQREDRRKVEPYEISDEKLVPPTRIERAARGLGNPSGIKEDTTSNPLPDKETHDLKEDSQ
jgi:hypothetical protein